MQEEGTAIDGLGEDWRRAGLEADALIKVRAEHGGPPRAYVELKDVPEPKSAGRESRGAAE